MVEKGGDWRGLGTRTGTRPPPPPPQLSFENP